MTLGLFLLWEYSGEKRVTPLGNRLSYQTKESNLNTITGQCHCGSVRYEAEGPIVKSSYCDCPGCRRATGTFKVPFLTILRDNLKLMGSEPVEYRPQSGDRCDEFGTYHFCPKCGSQIYWKGHQGNELDLFAGTLDDATLFKAE